MHLHTGHSNPVGIKPRTSFTPIGETHPNGCSGEASHQGTAKQSLEIYNQVEMLCAECRHLREPPPHSRLQLPHTIDPLDPFDETSPLLFDESHDLRLCKDLAECRQRRHGMDDITQRTGFDEE